MESAERHPQYETWDLLCRDGAFEEALAALREVVDCLESGELRLDDAVRCFEMATLLSKRCEQLLEEAELRVSRLDDEPDAAPAGAHSLFDGAGAP